MPRFMEKLTGEMAAVGTAMLFAMGCTFFTLAGRRAGASVVNRSRLLIATLLALSIHWITRGTPLPRALSWEAWGWLAFSGVVGLATLMSLTPLFLLPVSRLVFHEPVTLRAVVGTLLALTGVALLLQ